MKQDLIKIRSSLSTSLMQAILFKGTFLAFCGVLLLSYEGIFLKTDALKTWGLPILILAGILISWGLIPYRRLCRLETNPHEIVLDSQHLQFFMNKQLVVAVPLISIKKIIYIDSPKHQYGIGIQFKSPLPQKIIVKTAASKIKKLQKHSECDLFLPYFSRRSYKTILTNQKN